MTRVSKEVIELTDGEQDNLVQSKSDLKKCFSHSQGTRLQFAEKLIEYPGQKWERNPLGKINADQLYVHPKNPDTTMVIINEE